VLVEDDVHVQTQVPKFSYLGDSLELQFDINLEADYSTAVNGDDYQYLISPGNFVELPPDGFRFRGNANGLMSDAAGTALQVVAIANEGGYIIEMAIPWQDMGLGAVGEGVKLGAALSINDNDTPGSAKQELMLSHVASRRWADPSSWGTLTLVKN
ncbi:MAG: hypothetical protein KAG66_05535, partial [Methylococcales bacterium]|nr:hypothetical protein [Methylococcales bacterium]